MDRSVRLLKHIAFIAAGLLLFLVLPGFLFGNAKALLGSGVDAASSASMVITDQPSGEYVVVLNKDRHPLSLSDWEAFFSEQPVGVIMEDISCMVMTQDPSGIQLAQRYLARLAQNQMELTEENSLLVVSRGENGLYDVIVVSLEMADAMDFSKILERPEALVINVGGGA